MDGNGDQGIQTSTSHRELSYSFHSLTYEDRVLGSVNEVFTAWEKQGRLFRVTIFPDSFYSHTNHRFYSL